MASPFFIFDHTGRRQVSAATTGDKTANLHVLRRPGRERREDQSCGEQTPLAMEESMVGSGIQASHIGKIRGEDESAL